MIKMALKVIANWIGAESNHVRESKTVLDSEFHRVFRIPGARFRIPIINRILDSLSLISDFKARDSEFQKQNSRIPEYELPYTGRIKDRHNWLLGWYAPGYCHAFRARSPEFDSHVWSQIPSKFRLLSCSCSFK